MRGSGTSQMAATSTYSASEIHGCTKASGMAERAMCLAEALKLCGLERALPRQHGADFFREHIQIGLQRFVTREGLA